jgi:plasmid stabilization system protein ParE
MSVIEFHPAAADEAVEARRWYAAIGEHLSTAFQHEFDQAVKRITETPERWTPHIAGTQVCLLRRFPFLVVYRVREKRIEIVAVQHCRRRPDYWRSRLEG